MANKEDVEKQEKTITQYTKNQLIKSSKYAGHRDILTALLEEGKVYSFDEIDKIVSNFMKGKVK